MKRLLINGIIFIAALLAFVSCSENTAQSEIGFLPFKSSENGKWGMIGTDGTVLFEEEFKDEPTVAMNDRFLVKNGNDQWEIFTTDARPEKVGDEYIGIARFSASVTPSVKKNEKICIIDVDGNVKATLDKSNGKAIGMCSNFYHGYAIIFTEDEEGHDFFGIINTKGEIVVESKYAVAKPLSSSHFLTIMGNKDRTGTVRVLNTSGKEVLTMKIGEGQKYTNVNHESCNANYLAVCTIVDGEGQWGYIDFQKNVVVKPSSKIKELGGIKGDNFIFSDGQNYGVMNFKGEVVLRAKYDRLSWADDDILISYDSKESRYSLINLEGDKITREGYLEIYPFMDGEHAAVKINDNSWGFIDKNGEELKMKNAPDIYYISRHEGCDFVQSDFVDIDAIIARLKLNKNGLMGFNLDMFPQQIVKAYNEVEGNKNEKLDATPKENLSCVGTSYSSRGLKIESWVNYSYEHPMSEYIGGEFVWTKAQPINIEVFVEGGMLEGKTDLLYNKIAAIVKSYGKVMKENSGAVIVKMTDKRGWVITNQNSQLIIRMMGNGDYQDYDIDSCAKNGETTKEYIKPSGNSSIEEYAIVDTTDYAPGY